VRAGSWQVPDRTFDRPAGQIGRDDRFGSGQFCELHIPPSGAVVDVTGVEELTPAAVAGMFLCFGENGAALDGVRDGAIESADEGNVCFADCGGEILERRRNLTGLDRQIKCTVHLRIFLLLPALGANLGAVEMNKEPGAPHGARAFSSLEMSCGRCFFGGLITARGSAAMMASITL